MHNHLLSFCFIQNRCQDWGKLIPFNIIMSAPLTWINLTHMYSIDIFYKSIALISLFFSLVTTRKAEENLKTQLALERHKNFANYKSKFSLLFLLYSEQSKGL